MRGGMSGDILKDTNKVRSLIESVSRLVIATRG